VAILIIVGIIAVAAILLTATNGGTVVNAGGSGANLTAQQIAGYAANAGFTGPDLQVAVAVALAESGGNPSVTGDLSITPGGSVGLWQINLKAHPEYTAAQLMDPQTNANAAYAIYAAAGNQFTPWTTYNSPPQGTGTYANFIVQAQQGVNA
jgi:hypothetical protein